MMEAVEAAIAHEDICLIEAGTGVGKTLAYLAPALLSGRQTVVATGTRTLMDQIVNNDVPVLEQALSTRFSVTTLKGRSNYLCLARLHAHDYSLFLDETMARIRQWASKTSAGDFAELKDVPEGDPTLRKVACDPEGCQARECPYFSGCFLFAARARARNADLIITNHHLFFADLALRDERSSPLLPDRGILIFDEAHGLEDVAAGYFGKSISASRVEDLSIDALALGQRGDPASSRLLIAVAQRLKRSFLDLLKGFVEGDARVEVNIEALPDRVVSAWHALDCDLELLSQEARDKAQELGVVSDISDKAERVRETLGKILGDTMPGHVRIATKQSIEALPVDVSGALRERVFLSQRPIILVSATLTVDGSTGFFRQRLGVPDGAMECILASPYDFANNVLLYVPDYLPEPNDKGYIEAFAEETLQLLECTDGRAFILFTSHAALKQAVAVMRQRLRWQVFVQGEAAREQLLQRFREAGNACLFGTATFWEGVDVAGPALSCVVIDRLPFDPPDEPLTRARARAVREAGLNEFRDFSLPLAVTRLRQGFGRLVRSRNDRGVVAIMDRRILGKGYGQVFQRSLPPARLVSDLEEVRAWCRRRLRSGRQK